MAWKQVQLAENRLFVDVSDALFRASTSTFHFCSSREAFMLSNFLYNEYRCDSLQVIMELLFAQGVA